MILSCQPSSPNNLYLQAQYSTFARSQPGNSPGRQQAPCKPDEPSGQQVWRQRALCVQGQWELSRLWEQSVQWLEEVGGLFSNQEVGTVTSLPPSPHGSVHPTAAWG